MDDTKSSCFVKYLASSRRRSHSSKVSLTFPTIWCCAGKSSCNWSLSQTTLVSVSACRTILATRSRFTARTLTSSPKALYLGPTVIGHLRLGIAVVGTSVLALVTLLNPLLYSRWAASKPGTTSSTLTRGILHNARLSRADGAPK